MIKIPLASALLLALISSTSLLAQEQVPEAPPERPIRFDTELIRLRVDTGDSLEVVGEVGNRRDRYIVDVERDSDSEEPAIRDGGGWEPGPERDDPVIRDGGDGRPSL